MAEDSGDTAIRAWSGCRKRRGASIPVAVQTLRLGRRADRLRLAELGKLAGGLGYAAVSKAITRFGRRLVLDVALSQQLAVIQNQLSK